jgi:hypothetical protein
VRFRNLERRLLTKLLPLMTFTLGISELAASAGADDVIAAVYQEALMEKGVRPDEGMYDVGHDELPCEILA